MGCLGMRYLQSHSGGRDHVAIFKGSLAKRYYVGIAKEVDRDDGHFGG